MTLEDAINQLGELDEDTIICARAPWSPASEAMVVNADAQNRVPREVTDQGFLYFLETDVAREVLEVFQGRPGGAAEKIACLIYYATNDAYPAWVYT